MDLFGMLIWAVVLISLIVFIILLVKSFKSWGVVHTVLLSILFIESWTFLFLAAAVNFKRLTLTKQHDQLMEKVEKLSKQVDVEMYGDRLNPVLNLEKFVPLSNELNRLSLERGRVWRGAMRQQAPAGKPGELPAFSVRLASKPSNVPGEQPAGAAASGAAVAAPAIATSDSGLAAESVVYAFGEVNIQINANNVLVPNVYLGEFLVVENKDGNVLLRPTAPLSKVQEAVLGRGTHPTWAIYEVVPVDSHVAFAAQGSAPERDSVFGRMDPSEIGKLLGLDPNLAKAEPNSLNPVEARRAKLLKSYLDDGQRAPEQTTDESLAYRVTFKREHTIAVDSVQKGNAMEGGYYNSEGKTVDERLKSGLEEGVKFNEGDSYVFDAAAARKLEQEGVVTLEDRIFVRPLNDYEYGFREMRRLTTRARQDLILLNRELEESTRTTQVTLEQEIKRGEESNKLKLDKAQYKKELDVITDVADKLQSEVTAKATSLSQLYSQMVQLHDRIVRRSNEIAGTVAIQP
jgi:hypothetical protein